MKNSNIRLQGSDFFWKIYDFRRENSRAPVYYAYVCEKLDNFNRINMFEI